MINKLFTIVLYHILIDNAIPICNRSLPIISEFPLFFFSGCFCNPAWKGAENVLYSTKRQVQIMEYSRMIPGRFLSRPNRFLAHVEIGGETQVVHVKNTGRCRELLTPGARVWCQESDNPNRKTKYDLITVQKGDRLINMDSQAPNLAAGEWLRAGGLGEIENLKAESFHGDSRFDFSFTKDGKPCFLEVKGVTLEQDGVCAFPDAPTDRGTKHLKGLTRLAREGFGAYVLFVIQMPDVKYLHPNDATDPAFGAALREAMDAGVQILAMDCAVTESTMDIRLPVLVKL